MYGDCVPYFLKDNSNFILSSRFILAQNGRIRNQTVKTLLNALNAFVKYYRLEISQG